MIFQGLVPCTLRMFVSSLKRHANSRNKNDIFCPCVGCENTIWTKHGEIDNTLLELDIGIGDNNSHGQDDSVFDGDDHDAAAAADDFDFQELLRHVEPHMLSSMRT
jgi:hypothetical protein